MSATHHYTASDLAAMPEDGNRYEIVHGELLVTPSPIRRHQAIAGDLLCQLMNYLRPYGLDKDVSVAPSDVFAAFDTVVEPDLYVANSAAASWLEPSIAITALYLAIEVVSPSSVRADREVKRRLYQEERIAQYWIVDAGQRHVEVWTPEASLATVEREVITWRHPSVDVTCEIDLVKLFDFG